MCICVVYFRDFARAEKILREKCPWQQKYLGRKVRNFDETEWNKINQKIVKQGSLEKVVWLSTYIFYCYCYW